MGQVQYLLVIRVRMDRGHKPFLNPKMIMDHFGHRSKAVRCAGRIGNDMMLIGVVFLIVDAHHDRDVFFFAWRGNDHLFRPSLKVFSCVCTFGKSAGAFHHDLNAHFLPRKCGRVFFSVDFDNLIFINHYEIPVNPHLSVKRAMH